jgi:hypothetical protein
MAETTPTLAPVASLQDPNTPITQLEELRISKAQMQVLLELVQTEASQIQMLQD